MAQTTPSGIYGTRDDAPGIKIHMRPGWVTFDKWTALEAHAVYKNNTVVAYIVNNHGADYDHDYSVVTARGNYTLRNVPINEAFNWAFHPF